MKHPSIRRSPSRSLRQKGMSLLEVIAYLGVAAVIIIGAVALLSSAFGNSRANRTQEELASINTSVKRLFMSRAGAYGSGSLNDPLIAAKAFPPTLAVSGSEVLNAWNGDVTVTGNTSTFDVSYGNVPQSVCVELLSTTSQFLTVAANGASALTPPVTLTDAAAQCDQAEENTIVWSGR